MNLTAFFSAHTQTQPKKSATKPTRKKKYCLLKIRCWLKHHCQTMDQNVFCRLLYFASIITQSSFFPVFIYYCWIIILALWLGSTICLLLYLKCLMNIYQIRRNEMWQMQNVFEQWVCHTNRHIETKPTKKKFHFCIQIQSIIIIIHETVSAPSQHSLLLLLLCYNRPHKEKKW